MTGIDRPRGASPSHLSGSAGAPTRAGSSRAGAPTRAGSSRADSVGSDAQSLAAAASGRENSTGREGTGSARTRRLSGVAVLLGVLLAGAAAVPACQTGLDGGSPGNSVQVPTFGSNGMMPITPFDPSNPNSNPL